MHTIHRTAILLSAGAQLTISAVPRDCPSKHLRHDAVERQATFALDARLVDALRAPGVDLAWLGAVQGVRWQKVRPFACSFLAATTKGSLFVLVWNRTATDLAEIAGLGDRVRVLRLPPSEDASALVQHARYRAYAHFLAANPDVKTLGVSDATDVVFQRDPFALARDPRHLVVSDESARYTVASEPSGGNRYWVRCLYGPPLRRAVGARRVSCSGATVGGRDAMRAYLETMASELAALLPPRVMHDMPRSIPFNFYRGFDQGIHNALLESAFALAYNVTRSTADLFTGNGQRLGSDYELREGAVFVKGAAAAVVHQWNRMRDGGPAAARCSPPARAAIARRPSSKQSNISRRTK